MKSREKTVFRMLTITFFAMIIMFFVLKITAEAGSGVMSKDYSACEATFKSDIRAVLGAEGIKNPGINVSRLSEDGKTLEYTVLINLPSYTALSSDREADLMVKLNGLKPVKEAGSVKYSFSK
ncbi:MAG: hypothetical protein K5796_00515 [Lachnospiraceae bacterium]|nr:hypothetical protein [Lachnospiraceae bacterium]